MKINKSKIKKLFLHSIKVKKLIVNSNADKVIYQMAKTITKALKKGNKLLLCGNGGSASDAQHLATELLIRLRPHITRKALPAISLTMDSSVITACANDFEFNAIFERMTEALGQKGDILLGISTSGNSENVNRAFKKAKKLKMKTISFLGNNGGKSKGICDLEYIVPSNDTGRIQESHIMLGHILLEITEDMLKNDKYI